MAQPQKCAECDEMKERGHNYCRLCGFWLRKGYVQHVRLALVYRTKDRFCGYCGAPRKECKC